MKVTDELLDYYNRELVFLRDMGDQFAQANPLVAGLLAMSAGRCEDPHVERLMQSFAFLAARIRKKLDDQYPEIADALLSVVAPDYLRPSPSATIVWFEGSKDPTKTAAGQTAPRGAPLRSAVSINDVRCQFRTTQSVTIWPVEVVEATLATDRVVLEGKPKTAVSLLKLSLRCAAPGGWESLRGLKSLRFFLDGAEPVPSILYECLFHRLVEIGIRGETSEGKPLRWTLPRNAVRPVGFGPEEQLHPYPNHAFPGHGLLREFFEFPQKFLFFDLLLTGPEGNSAPPLASAKPSGPIEVFFWLDSPPRAEIAVRAGNFRLGCAPAVNLFRWVPDPIVVNQLQSEYLITPNRENPSSFEVYSVDRVASSGSFLEEPREFEPFYAMRHSARSSPNTAYWFAHRRASPRGGGTEVSLSFSDPNFNPLTPAVERITATLTCTNRNLPSRLPFGGQQGWLEPETEAAVGRAQMLMRPTESLAPPVGRSAQWRLISRLGLNHLPLASESASPDGSEAPGGAEPLRELLALYDFAGTETTRKMIHGIIGVAHERIAARVAFPDPLEGGDASAPRARAGRPLGKPLSLGLEVRLRFDEDDFPGAMAFLMASVLDRFFGACASINSFTQLVATSKQRQGAWRWPPRGGDRTLL